VADDTVGRGYVTRCNRVIKDVRQKGRAERKAE
jgi:hypothetical protein